MVEVKAILLKDADLSAKVDQTSKLPRPEPSDATKEKSRWLQGIVINRTQFKLATRDSYFDSGRYETNPDDVDAWSIGQFTVVDKDGSVFTGATGANGWDLQLQSDLDINLSFGWTAPRAGANKSAVIESINTSVGYDNAVENGNTIISKNEYQGADSDDNPISINFKISCDGGQRPVYTVTQVNI